MCRNKLAYSGHQVLLVCPDAVASGLPALRVLLSDPETFPLCVLCELERVEGAGEKFLTSKTRGIP